MIKTDVFVIGAGMSGLAMANELSSSGLSVACADKARGSGGRLSSKRVEHPLGTISFDLGASGFTAQTNDFKAKLEEWQKHGVVDYWQEKNGQPIYVGVPRSSSVTRYMADQTHVHFATRVTKLEKCEDGWHVYHHAGQGENIFALSQQVVLASPAAQTYELLPDHHVLKARLRDVEIFSQWVMMIALDEALDIPDLTMSPSDSIEIICLENSKPQRGSDTGLYIYAVQASTQWSQKYIDESDDTIKQLLVKELEKLLQLKLPLKDSYVHRWLYSQGSLNGHADAGFLTSDDGLFVCGDYLLSKLNVGGVESAFLSGKALGQFIIKQTNELDKVG